VKFGFLFRKEVNEYDFGKGHPFHGRRGEEFLKLLKEKTKKEFPILEAEPAKDEDLFLICSKDYIEFTKNFFEAKHLGKDFNGRFYLYHSQDNFPGENPGNIEKAARFIVGQAKLAADLVLGSKLKKVISLGGGLHHARFNFGEGFCLYNDVAFCAKYLLEKYNLERILILDTDAHGGNGTMEYFWEEKRVLFIDIHQDPTTLYPGTGFIEQIGGGEGRGFTVNIPLPPFSGDRVYKLVFEEIVEPIVKKFKPQIILRNGGSDPHFSDPLTNLNLTIEGFKMIGEKVRELSKISDEREIDFIASGYNLKTLPYCWLALVSGLLDLKIPLEKEKEIKEPEEVIEKAKEIVFKIKKILKPYWF
jgi:acetoin utilization protein AcuC